MSGVVQQLKKERERAQGEVQRINAALAALGGSARLLEVASHDGSMKE